MDHDLKKKGASRAPFFFILLLVLLLPLVFFPGLISLYRLPKNTLFALLTSLICWSWLLTQVRREDRPSLIFPLFLPFVAFLTLTGLSLFKAVNPYEGIIAFSLTALGMTLFWISFNEVEFQTVPYLFRWIVFTAGVVSLLGILQTWGVSFPGLISIASPGSTFGNKNMAAQFLIFALPAAFYLLLSESNQPREKLYALLTGLISTYFVYTETRAAWGAMAFAFLALWVLFRFAKLSPQNFLTLNKRKSNLLIVVFIFVLAMNTLPRYFLPGFGATSVLDRIHSMLEIEEDVAAHVRFSVWANTMAMFRDHPIIGVGKGNFRFVYPLYARKAVKDTTFGPTTKAGDTHNDYLQLLAETGIVGTFALGLIIILLGKRIWFGFRHAAGPELVVIAFSLLAILALAFWDFPFNHPVPIAFFGIFCGMAWRLTETSSETPRETNSLPVVVALVLTIASTAFSAVMFSSLYGHFYYSKGAWAMAEGDFDKAEPKLQSAIKINPLNYRHHFLYGLLMIKRGEYKNAIDPIGQSLLLNPYDINAWNNLGVAHASLGNIPKATQAFEASLRIWPYYVDSHNNLGTIYAHQGEKEKAIRHFRAVVRLDADNAKALNALKVLGEPLS